MAGSSMRSSKKQLMFIGHYAIAFAARRPGNMPSLAVLFIAVQLLDLIWPILVLAGIETFRIQEGNTAMTPLDFTHYPYSHSLLMAVAWGVLFAFVYFLFTKNRNGALLLIPLVVSHWLLDFITHRPDLQLSPFSETRVGLGLWNSPTAGIALETAMFLVGIIVYYVKVKPKRTIAFWSLVSLFLLFYFMNIFGPPPPSVQMVAWSANLMWLFVLWAFWLEKEPTKLTQPASAL
jgi:membrane-bound metal-dependent hydrolase YbcI (DUF457 family)